jgi:hypothetical protein
MIDVCSGTLDDVEAFELGMAEIELAVVAGVAVRRAEMLRFRPGDEIVMGIPDCTGREQSMIHALGAAQEMEFAKAGHLVEMAVAALPDVFEHLFGTGRNLFVLPQSAI